jgi:aspartate-semialdehyde dehydrogenase
MAGKIPVGILGATGVVGQRFIQMLEHHPWFEVAWLAASDRSEGRPYAEATRWRLKTAIPERVGQMMVSPATPSAAPKVIFAALDASIAAELEPRFAEAGCAVVSNSSALRMKSDVPLVIPEVNPDHLKLLECQAWRRQSGGFTVTNPNCSAIGLVLALVPLHQRFGIETVMVVTMQAVSGAGYPGVASLDILGNVIPFIAKEEEKMEEETRKLLGSLNGAGIRPAAFGMSPTAPEKPVVYVRATDRPQPRFDADLGAGMTTTVGRLRPCGVLDWKFTVLSHNTIRGAAGAALLNAELLKAQGYLG